MFDDLSGKNPPAQRRRAAVQHRMLLSQWNRGILGDILRSLYHLQAGSRRLSAGPASLSSLRAVFNSRNRGIRGKVFEEVLVGAINRGDQRVMPGLLQVMRTIRIQEPLNAIHVAFERSEPGALMDALRGQGWHPERLQYLDGKLGRPVELYRHLEALSFAFRNPGSAAGRLAGAEKADLWIGNRASGRIAGVTVKLDRSLLVPTPGVRIAMFAERSGAPWTLGPGGLAQRAVFDPVLDLWLVRTSDTFMAPFAEAWNLAILLLHPVPLPAELAALLRGSEDLRKIYAHLDRHRAAPLEKIETLLEMTFFEKVLLHLNPRELQPEERWNDPRLAAGLIRSWPGEAEAAH